MSQGVGGPPAPEPEGPPTFADMEELGTPEEWEVLGKLLRALAAGLRMRRGGGS